jgi:hypothetical protein
MAAALATAFALQTPSLTAADLAVRVDVPFDFYVGHTYLPAGVYTITTNANGKVVQLTGKGGKAATVVSYQTQTKGDSPRNAVVFRQYANAHFLAELRGPGGGQTMVLARSKTERRFRNATPAVAATRTLEP